MDVTKARKVCPYCRKTTDIGEIYTKYTIIHQCGGCLAVWENILDADGKFVYKRLDGTNLKKDLKLMYIYPHPKIYGAQDEEIGMVYCPKCFSLTDIDYKDHYIECNNPICDYTRRLPGEASAVRLARKALKEFKNLMFKRVMETKTMSPEDSAELKRLEEDLAKAERL